MSLWASFGIGRVCQPKRGRSAGRPEKFRHRKLQVLDSWKRGDFKIHVDWTRRVTLNAKRLAGLPSH